MTRHNAGYDAPSIRYRIEKDYEPYEDGTLETHPWAVSVIRSGEWSGACRYKTFAEALAEYVTESDARVVPQSDVPESGGDQ